MFRYVKIENLVKLLINKCVKYLCARKFFINLQTQNPIQKVRIEYYRKNTIRNPLNYTFVDSKSYTYDEAFQSSLEYFKGDELAARVWVNKYALKDSFGNIFEKNPARVHRELGAWMLQG